MLSLFLTSTKAPPDREAEVQRSQLRSREGGSTNRAGSGDSGGRLARWLPKPSGTPQSATALWPYAQKAHALKHSDPHALAESTKEAHFDQIANWHLRDTMRQTCPEHLSHDRAVPAPSFPRYRPRKPAHRTWVPSVLRPGSTLTDPN